MEEPPMTTMFPNVKPFLPVQSLCELFDYPASTGVIADIILGRFGDTSVLFGFDRLRDGFTGQELQRLYNDVGASLPEGAQKEKVISEIDSIMSLCVRKGFEACAELYGNSLDGIETTT
jgi:hypothetical protein